MARPSTHSSAGHRRGAARSFLAVLPAVLTLPILASAAAGILGAYLESGTFWWAAIAAILLPATLALVMVAAIILILLRQWGWAIAATAMLLTGLLATTPIGSGYSPPEPSDDDLVIMTFSVARYGQTPEVLAQDILELLEEQEPDLVALQKAAAWRHHEEPSIALVADYIRPALDSLGYVVAIPEHLAEHRTALPILARLNGPVVLEQEEGVLDDDELASRYLRSLIRWNGREAVLYNLHLRGYGPEKPWEEEDFPMLQPRDWLPFVRRYRDAFRQRADEVRVLRQRLDAEEVPVVLAGDLNVTPRNWDYRQLTNGRVDAFRAAGRGWGATYRGDRPLVRIDYILLDEAFTPVAAHVPPVRFSNHRPVVARLRWADEPTPNRN